MTIKTKRILLIVSIITFCYGIFIVPNKPFAVADTIDMTFRDYNLPFGELVNILKPAWTVDSFVFISNSVIVCLIVLTCRTIKE